MVIVCDYHVSNNLELGLWLGVGCNNFIQAEWTESKNKEFSEIWSAKKMNDEEAKKSNESVKKKEHEKKTFWKVESSKSSSINYYNFRQIW